MHLLQIKDDSPEALAILGALAKLAVANVRTAETLLAKFEDKELVLLATAPNNAALIAMFAAMLVRLLGTDVIETLATPITKAYAESGRIDITKFIGERFAEYIAKTDPQPEQ